MPSSLLQHHDTQGFIPYTGHQMCSHYLGGLKASEVQSPSYVLSWSSEPQGHLSNPSPSACFAQAEALELLKMAVQRQAFAPRGKQGTCFKQCSLSPVLFLSSDQSCNLMQELINSSVYSRLFILQRSKPSLSVSAHFFCRMAPGNFFPNSLVLQTFHRILQ